MALGVPGTQDIIVAAICVQAHSLVMTWRTERVHLDVAVNPSGFEDVPVNS